MQNAFNLANKAVYELSFERIGLLVICCVELECIRCEQRPRVFSWNLFLNRESSAANGQGEHLQRARTFPMIPQCGESLVAKSSMVPL